MAGPHIGEMSKVGSHTSSEEGFQEGGRVCSGHAAVIQRAVHGIGVPRGRGAMGQPWRGYAAMWGLSWCGRKAQGTRMQGVEWLHGLLQGLNSTVQCLGGERIGSCLPLTIDGGHPCDLHTTTSGECRKGGIPHVAQVVASKGLGGGQGCQCPVVQPSTQPPEVGRPVSGYCLAA